jgi:hypothetical protein
MRAPRSSVEKNLDVNLRKEWWIIGGLGPNKIFCVKTTHKHREADKSTHKYSLELSCATYRQIKDTSFLSDNGARNAC